MSNEKKLDDMSKECKRFSNKFDINNIINDWICLFEKIDKMS